VESKLHAPDAREEWVRRQHLVRDLAAAEARLILVDAPAGFGKTILIAQWRSAAGEARPFAWITLDPADDDPARLWWHVVLALERACPGLADRDLLRFLRTRAPDIMGTLLPALVNALAELSEPVVLVLDDYHSVKEPSCHEQVEFLLVNLLPPAQAVIITRAGPPLPLARLRAAGEMTEIRMNELRFAPDEAAALIGAVAGVRLGERDLAGLVDRTEGWPAGVYLAALSLRGRPAPSSFVQQFTGNNKYISDYLFEEVIDRQPAHVQQFLTRTAILDGFSAPLCEAVTEAADAAGLIDVLERENLFVVPLDDNRQWLRYHHLFAEVLRRQLELREPEIVPTLHRRASTWHAAHGTAARAIEHALAGGDVTGAVDLIAGHWLAQVDVGRMRTVRGWIAALGDEQISANPLAAHCAAWTSALSGERETVRRLLPIIEAGEHAGRLPDGMQSLEFSAVLLRTFGFDGIAVMRESAARAVELESDPLSPWYALAQAVLAFSLYLSGEPGAEGPARQAVLSETPDPLIRLLALAAASLIAAEGGRLGQAEAFATAARQLVDDSGLSNAPQSSLAYTASGLVLAKEGRLEEARRELERSLRTRRRWFGLAPWPTVETALGLASVLLELGDGPGAAELLAEAKDVLTALPDGAEAQRVRVDVLHQRLSRLPRVSVPAESLTERQTAILRLLQGTMSLSEIARDLHLSRNTIKTHVRAIYRKLGVSTRRDAVARGHQLDLV